MKGKEEGCGSRPASNPVCSTVQVQTAQVWSNEAIQYNSRRKARRTDIDDSAAPDRMRVRENYPNYWPSCITLVRINRQNDSNDVISCLIGASIPAVSVRQNERTD